MEIRNICVCVCVCVRLCVSVRVCLELSFYFKFKIISSWSLISCQSSFILRSLQTWLLNINIPHSCMRFDFSQMLQNVCTCYSTHVNLISSQDGEMSVVAESQVAVMHDRAKIISNATWIGVFLDDKIELHPRTRGGVLRQDFQCVVAVDAGLEWDDWVAFIISNILSTVGN